MQMYGGTGTSMQHIFVFGHKLTPSTTFRILVIIILLLHNIVVITSVVPKSSNPNSLTDIPNQSILCNTAVNIWKSLNHSSIMTTTTTTTIRKSFSSVMHHKFQSNGQSRHSQNNNNNTACILAASPNKPKPDSALKSFLSGGVGGICTVIVGHPFDLIKVKIQTSAQHASVFSMLTQTFQKEGIRGIYRGVSAPLVAISPMFAVSFWGYDMGKRIVQSVDERWIQKKEGDVEVTTAVAYPFTIPQLCLAGGISALPTTLIMAPSERLKCLLQIHPERYSGLWDCAKKVYAEGGIQSVFRGTGATLLRDIPGSIAWFGTYELVKKGLMKVQKIDPESGVLSPLAVLCAGGVAGMACWAVSIPADVLKSRFQTAPAGTYSGVMDVYRHLMKEEGPTALFRGLRPAMIRAFPANAACFFGMEVSKKAFAFMD